MKNELPQPTLTNGGSRVTAIKGSSIATPTITTRVVARGVRAATLSPSTRALTSISGVVTEEKSGLPLAGVTVKWARSGTRRKRGAEEEFTILGTAKTDQQGLFVIEPVSDETESTCGPANGHSVTGETVLFLADNNGKMVGRPTMVNADVSAIELHPPAEEAEQPATHDWKALANYLLTNRLMLVRDAASQLATPSPDSPVAQWAVTARAAGLRAVFDAASAGQAPQTLDLLEQRQFIEPAALGEGKIGVAVTHFIDPNRLGDYPSIVGKVFPWVSQSDRGLYRDYLRGVWVSAAQRMYQETEHITAPAAMLERQLDERFLQDFHTGNDLSKPAAQWLVPLLTSILMRDPTRGGFGLAAAAIPPQGAQSADDYLASLIVLSKVDAQELRNRFRVAFVRSPGETTTPLQLNIEALLGLLSDTYQSPIEPFIALPPILDNGHPLIFGNFVGLAPFFLEYEEWLERQRVYFPENVYDIRRNLPDFNADYRSNINLEAATPNPMYPGEGYFDDYPGERPRSGAWIKLMFPIVDKIREGCKNLDGQLYPDALASFDAASKLLWSAAGAYDSKWVKDKFWWWNSVSGSWNNQPEAGSGKLYSDIRVSLNDRAKIAVTTPEQLTSFEKFFDPPYYPLHDGNPNDFDTESAEKGAAKARTLYLYDVFYLDLVLIPYLQSQVYFAQGDFAKAIRALALLTGYRVGIAETVDPTGYDPQSFYARLYNHDTLPYTTNVGFTQDQSAYADLPPIFQETDAVGSGMPLSYGKLAIAPFEQRFFKLAQGDVMLAWADQLYRNDDPSSIRRARELYKGVLFMHGVDPEIAPNFPRDGGRVLPLPPGFDPYMWKYHDNPAKVSQTNRAQLALYQIEQGLNVYGYREDMVPVLRYKPLKQAADLFATSAKSAQTDFLNYMTRYEQALIELWQTQSLLKKAQASSGIASERVAIAQAGVDKAKEQVTAVQAQIAAKQKEIADKGSLFSQFEDYLSGAKDALSGMVPLAKKVMADDGGAAGSVTSDQMLDIFSKGASGGTGSAEDAAATALGSGAAFMVGYGAFVYASYTSMQSMADADAKRSGELKSLQDVSLAAAQAQVRLKQRDVTIAQYESQIAAADLEFASTLFRFQQDRFLSADFWNKLTLFANRLMRRYVELGARTAWLAERALAFEQNRTIEVIQLDYLPLALRGVTGADRLLADLAELEANRIQGVRLTTPVKHTISVARDFPLAFGQLKKTGRCRFQTREADLRQAYPGTFAYRIRAITVAANDSDGAAPRGILRNGGVSAVSAEDLSSKVLTRFPDALALSEFRLHDDLFVYGLPGETLLQFEGSGFETDWELEFPVAANPKGFRSVADVLITFDTNAYYSSAVAANPAIATPASAPRAIMLAASTLDSKGLASLKAAAGPARITFDPRKIALPAQEKTRLVANLSLICVGQTTKSYKAKLTASTAGKTAAFSIENGIALSNAGPLLGAAAPLPLNDLVGLDLNQPFVLELDRTGVADELKALFDVVIALEYTATF